MRLFDQLFDQVRYGSGYAPKIVTGPPGLLNTVVVDDRGLAGLDRDAPAGLGVTVINGTGAGGIAALVRRTLTNSRLSAIENPLRDPEDLVGNVARVAAAARELDPDVAVLVDIPDGFGWHDAVAAAEAEGLAAVASGDPDQLAFRLGAFVEADLPFVVDDIGSAGDLVALLTAVDVLIETGEVDDARAELAGLDHDRQAVLIRDWADDRAGRVRRRLRAVRTTDLPAMLAGLTAYGLVEAI